MKLGQGRTDPRADLLALAVSIRHNKGSDQVRLVMGKRWIRSFTRNVPFHLWKASRAPLSIAEWLAGKNLFNCHIVPAQKLREHRSGDDLVQPVHWPIPPRKYIDGLRLATHRLVQGVVDQIADEVAPGFPHPFFSLHPQCPMAATNPLTGATEFGPGPVLGARPPRRTDS